jgi:CubicO group peptidase (beta-lactamase class C family)
MKALYGALCGAFLCGAVPTAKINADMRAVVLRHQTVGMTIAIVQDGKPVFEHAYGMRDAESNQPATVTTDYKIGSITKQFTAAAVMQLVDAGKISLNAPLSTYLPQAPHASEVTIEELLAHTSGLPNYTDGADAVAASAYPVTFDALMARIASKPLLFPPGSQWSYSNTNYIILGRVIGVTSGQPYEQNFATMADEGKLPQMSPGYVRGGSAPPLDNSWAGAAGNLVGTVSDMIAWDQALSSGEVVPVADYTMMTTVQTPPKAQVRYGFAFFVDTYDGQPRVWHSGGTFGFSSTDQYYPQQSTRIIVLTNDSSAAADVLAQDIFNDMYPALATVQGEDAAFTARVRAVFKLLLSGKIDRSQFDDRANAVLTDAFVAKAAIALAPLGMPLEYRFEGCSMRGTTNFCKYAVTFERYERTLTVGADPAGKFNLFLIGL